MKIVIYVFVNVISICCGGLLGTSAILPQDNSIQSVTNPYIGTSYFGNYGQLGSLALKYYPTTINNNNLNPNTVQPLYMRLNTGKIIGNGIINPLTILSNPVGTNVPTYTYTPSFNNYNQPRILRIIQRPNSIVDPYRPLTTNYMNLPQSVPNVYGNLNNVNNHPLQMLKVVHNPSTIPQLSSADHDAMQRNYYQIPKVYPSLTPGSLGATPGIYPNSNPQTQSYTMTSYGGGTTTITGMHGLSPEVAKTIMKFVQRSPPLTSSSPSIPHMTSIPSSSNYLNNAPHPAVASNTIDDTPSATTNNIRFIRPLEQGSNYQSNAPTDTTNLKLGNILQIRSYQSSYPFRRYLSPPPLPHHQRYLNRYQQNPSHNSDHNHHQQQEQQHQHQQNLPSSSSSYDDTNDAISDSETNSNSINDITDANNNSNNNVTDSEAKFLQQFLNKE